MRLSVTKIETFIHAKQSWIEKHQKWRRTKDENPLQKEYSNVEIRAMKSDLLAYLERRIPELWHWMNLPQYTSIKVTKSERRWWSCSGKNWLCFSYRLAEWLDFSHENEDRERFIQKGYSESVTLRHLPISGEIFPCIDAIIVHELAHLREKNHQKPFWDLVYQMMPDYESRIKILKKISPWREIEK